VICVLKHYCTIALFVDVFFLCVVSDITSDRLRAVCMLQVFQEGFHLFGGVYCWVHLWVE
jgi:hypothetical protein